MDWKTSIISYCAAFVAAFIKGEGHIKIKVKLAQDNIKVKLEKSVFCFYWRKGIVSDRKYHQIRWIKTLRFEQFKEICVVVIAKKYHLFFEKEKTGIFTLTNEPYGTN